jgi:putative ABC transport system ATP-binding protein
MQIKELSLLKLSKKLIIMIIKTESLKRFFQVGSEKVEALKGIDLSVERGEFLSIMGPSGSGKTTLMNIIGCLRYTN